MPKRRMFVPLFKFWITLEGKRVLGKGGAAILEEIGKEESISKAAKKLGMSYRYVWNYLDNVKRIVGQPIVQTFRGGRYGGGGAKLTELGKCLLSEYNRICQDLENLMASQRKGGGIYED